MCIIAIKKAGVKMPSMDTIRTMFRNNPDGAGFAYIRDGRVCIRKGFMTLNTFEAALQDEVLSRKNLENEPLLMHFRITTHGGTKPGNTHPFPVCDNVAVLEKPTCYTGLAVFHNGIIPITPRSGISDTMEYVVSQLAPLRKAAPDFFRNQHLMTMIQNATRSKLAFLTGDGEIYTIGDFETTAGGMVYSNGSWIPRVSYSTFDYRTKAELPWKTGNSKTKFLMPIDASTMFCDRHSGRLYEGYEFAVSQKGIIYRIDWDTGTAYTDTSVRSVGHLPTFDWHKSEAYECYASYAEMLKEEYE